MSEGPSPDPEARERVFDVRVLVRLALPPFLIFYVLCMTTTIDAIFGVGPGLFFFDDVRDAPAVGAFPMTTEAAAALEGMQPLLRIEKFNGAEVDVHGQREPGPVRLRRLALERPTNTFELVDRRGQRREITVHAGRPELSGLPGVFFVGAAYQLVGLIYLAVGVWVWSRRRKDPAAPWLLFLGMVAAIQLVQPTPDQALGWWLNLGAASVMPLYGPAVVGLGTNFTGVPLQGRLRLWRRTIDVAGVLLMPMIPLVYWAWSTRGTSNLPFRAILVLIGLELAVAVGLFLVVARRAMGKDRPPAMRRRARLLAFAALAGFGLPTAELVIFPFIGPPPIELVVPNLVCFAIFPLTVGYAIVRYQAFDLRIVLRRGLVYVVLSLAVSLAFVGVVLLLVDLVGARARSTAALWVTSMLLVVGIGLLQLRVQRVVDRWAHRKRDLYARGIEDVAAELVRANSLPALSATARRALIDVMGLSRAYVALRDGDAVDCLPLANLEDPETGKQPEEVPARFFVDEVGPVRRALELEAMTTAYDADALPSMAGAQPLGGDFWSTYGLEVVVPLLRRLEGERVLVGFLLLGPRQDRAPLDAEDQNLLRLLAAQLTVAAENTLAFEQIRALKAGLEDKVRARTAELEKALSELKSAEAHIIENEKQAMLGRLVAGIVHEVNTPLGALTSSADTLQRILTKMKADLPESGPATKRAEMGKELASLQVASAARLSGLMDSLSHFVSLDESDLREVDVREGLDSALSLLGRELGEQVRIVKAYPETLPTVRADAQRLNQAFLHILQNAARAVGATGEIHITVAVVEATVALSIRDDGPGIPTERQGDLFEFGFTKKAGRVGLRLGLPSSARTVREIGGQIRVDSEPGEGTAVHIELPACAATIDVA